MFGWARAQLRDLGPGHGTLLIARVAWSRTKARLANRLLPASQKCPCCGWTGSRFYDYIEVGYTVRNSACPRCDSHSRHRGFYLWLQEVYRLKERKGTALVFAPEKALAPLWQKADHLKLVRVDLAAARGVDILANMECLPIESDSMDLIWCHHVLEHVEKDRQAIAELSRLLNPNGGELIVSVPMRLGTTTREYGFADPHESGHWRLYGDDFVERLTASNLIVETLAHDLSSHACREFGITPERFYICRKSNSNVKRN